MMTTWIDNTSNHPGDNDLHMTGGENNFLNFDLLDLLNGCHLGCVDFAR